jgi:hypothetical protein
MLWSAPIDAHAHRQEKHTGAVAMKRPSSRFAAALGALWMLAAGAASAQPMPADHGAAMSAPLFVADMAVGSISVRLARPSMAEAITGAEVTGTWTTKSGQTKSAVVKTGEDGRATFTDVPAGSSFQAKTTVEGETLSTPTFDVPGEGGTRLLLIVGANAAEAMAEMTGGAAPSSAGTPQPAAVQAGKIAARDGLPAGALNIKVLGTDGAPIQGVSVELGRAQRASKMKITSALTDETGVAHFKDLETGEGTTYGAVVLRDGIRVATEPFSLEKARGSEGELKMPGRTNDLGVLRISAASRMMVELREDGVAVLQNLLIENTSPSIFDPGPRGLFIPLPDGFQGAEKLPGGAEVEIKEGEGVYLRGTLLPTSNLMAASQVRIGYILPTHEAASIEIVQPMRITMQGGVVMVPSLPAVGLSASGLRARPPERDDNGNELQMYDLDAVPSGHAMRLTVTGLPTRDQVGKWIAAILVAIIVGVGIFASARTRSSAVASGDAR